MKKILCVLISLVAMIAFAHAQAVFEGNYSSGPMKGITDVAGVRVAHVTKISGDGPLHPGIGPIRTGATAILPNDDIWNKCVSAATETFNGNGELTGTHVIKEFGCLDVPIVLTDTLDVGRACDGVVDWMVKHHPDIGAPDDVPIPVVGECDDQFLNDIQGRHITAHDVVDLLDHCSTGNFERGSVGAGTGMILFGFKGGIGSASRLLPASQGGYTVGVLVNANNGSQPQRDLVIDGVGIGRMLAKEKEQKLSIPENSSQKKSKKIPDGSIIVVVATDAPLEARQLHQIAKRAVLGLGRTGLTSNISSGDFIIAFSTTHWASRDNQHQSTAAIVSDDKQLNALFEATAEATQAAVYDALFSARTMVGANGRTIEGLPVERVHQMLQRSSQ